MFQPYFHISTKESVKRTQNNNNFDIFILSMHSSLLGQFS